MVSPDKMFNPHNLEDYSRFEVNEIIVFLQKKLLLEANEFEFLVPYQGKFQLIRKDERIIIE